MRKEIDRTKSMKVRVPEENQQELTVETEDTASEIERLSTKLSIKMSFAESIDANENEDKYYPVVESKLTGTKQRYRFRDLGNVPPDLMGQGHKVNNHAFKELVSLMTGDSESGISIKALANKYSSYKFHKYIGWGVYNGNTVFKYDNAVTAKGVIDSSYEGNLSINSRGSVEKYFAGIKELVVPYPALLTVYLVGMSGMITQMLNMADTNIMLNICGESSCGKTTAENVALSFWGNPQELSTSFNSTANRIEQIMAERKIMPVIIDDMLAGNTYSTERVKQKIINDQIFRYATGKLRGRMGGKEERYYGATISSSETSLLEKLVGSETDGQFYRMIELKVKKGDLTQDADHAKQLERLIRRNYGLGAFKIGQYMLSKGLTENNLQDRYDEWEEELLEDERLRGKDRLAKRLAIILVAAELLNAFVLDVDYNKVINMLIKSVSDTFEVSNEKQTAYENIKKFVSNNSEVFATNREAYNRNEHIGVCETNVFGHKELFVETSRMEALLKNVPLQQILRKEQTAKVKQPRNREIENVLKYWREKGWLYVCASSNGLYRKMKMGNETGILTYSIILD